jgi:hypothetical protein
MDYKFPTGHVVEEYRVGNARVLISDDYCRNRTKEEVDAILAGVAARAYADLISMEKSPAGAGSSEEDVANGRPK